MMRFSSVHTILVFATVYDVTHDLICKSYGCVYVIGENKVNYIPSEVTNEMLIFFHLWSLYHFIYRWVYQEHYYK